MFLGSSPSPTELAFGTRVKSPGYWQIGTVSQAPAKASTVSILRFRALGLSSRVAPTNVTAAQKRVRGTALQL